MIGYVRAVAKLCRVMIVAWHVRALATCWVCYVIIVVCHVRYVAKVHHMIIVAGHVMAGSWVCEQ